MKKYIILSLILLIGACTTTGSGQFSNLQEVQTKHPFEGLSKQEIISELGEPHLQYKKDGNTVFEYRYVSVYNNPLSYPPLIGLFFSPNRYTLNYLYLYFNKKDVVARYDILEKSGAYPPKKTLL